MNSSRSVANTVESNDSNIETHCRQVVLCYTVMLMNPRDILAILAEFTHKKFYIYFLWNSGES